MVIANPYGSQFFRPPQPASAETSVNELVTLFGILAHFWPDSFSSRFAHFAHAAHNINNLACCRQEMLDIW